VAALRTAALAALLLAGCASAPRPAAAASPAPVWPAPPEAPRARFAASFPDPAAERAEAPWWRRLGRALLGIEEGDSAPRLLERPFGLALDGEILLVADPDGGRLLAVDWRRGRARAIDCAVHAWEAPMAVAVAPDRTRYVADGAGVVARLPAAGGCQVFGSGKLERPTGLAFAGGRVWAVDPPRHDVVGFTPEGEEVLRFGGRGEAGGQLNFPTAIAAGPDGTLLVVDALNFRVSRFDLAGRFLGSFGRAGEDAASFVRPKALAVGGGGAVFVSDAATDQVKVFGASGRFSHALGEPGQGPGQLQAPAGVAVGDGHLFVADSLNRRVEIYVLLGEAS